MRQCVVCEKELTGKQVKFCSGVCKQKSHYETVSRQTNTYHSQTLRGLKRKLHLVDLRGGRCEECGYNKNLGSLEFHHLDPEQKELKLDLRHLSNNSMEKILDEFDKCKVLCSNCHREEHHPELEIEQVRVLVDKVNEKVTKAQVVGKPRCIDCDVEISYTYKRCTPCNNIFKRKVYRPEFTVLQSELDEHGSVWCAKKYGVTPKSIRRWMNLMKPKD